MSALGGLPYTRVLVNGVMETGLIWLSSFGLKDFHDKIERGENRSINFPSFQAFSQNIFYGRTHCIWTLSHPAFFNYRFATLLSKPQ